jgi:hypothetical protein
MPTANYRHPDGRRLHLDRRAGSLILLLAKGEPDDLLNTEYMATWFGVSAPWLELGRSHGYGPPFIRLGGGTGRVRYRRAAVIEWLKEREQRAEDRAEERRSQHAPASVAEGEPRDKRTQRKPPSDQAEERRSQRAPASVVGAPVVEPVASRDKRIPLRKPATSFSR